MHALPVPWLSRLVCDGDWGRRCLRAWSVSVFWSSRLRASAARTVGRAPGREQSTLSLDPMLLVAGLVTAVTVACPLLFGSRHA
jgi:hypothetical protein